MKKQIKRLSLKEMKAKAKKAEKQQLAKVTTGILGGSGGEAYKDWWD